MITVWAPWIPAIVIATTFVLCLFRPLAGLNVLLAILILGDRTAAHIHISIGSVPLYVTEVALAGLLLSGLCANVGLRQLNWPSRWPWKVFYLISAASFVRGLIVYRAVDVVRDSALVYYSLFTPLTAAILADNQKRMAGTVWFLGAMVLLKTLLTYTGCQNFYAERSAAAIVTVYVLVFSFFTMPLWERKYPYFAVLLFLAYQCFAYLFRSAWIGLFLALIFYALAFFRKELRWRHLLATILICVCGLILSVIIGPAKQFLKPTGTSDAQATLIAVTKSELSLFRWSRRGALELLSDKRDRLPVATPVNPVLDQFKSLLAGKNATNAVTRIWFWQDIIEDILPVHFNSSKDARRDPTMLTSTARRELENRLGPIRLDKEIKNPLFRYFAVGQPHKMLIGVPFGKRFVPPRIFYWLTPPTRYDPHNSFLSVLYRTGILGLAAFLWILGSELMESWRRLPFMTLESRLYTMGAIGCLLACFGDAFFFVSFENPFKGIFLWFFLGLLLALRTPSHELCK